MVQGRFGWDFINSPDRLTAPLIKENGEFGEPWDEALDLVAKPWRNQIQHGPDSIAVVSSARGTMRRIPGAKFTPRRLGTNN